MTSTLYLMVLMAVFAGPSMALIGRTQSSGATGTLTCNGRPATNVKVKLYDEDDTDMDDLMGQTTTDSRGSFRVSGHTDEITTIDPKVNIYHDCNDNLPCKRKFTIKIPNNYVTQGNTARNFYNIGNLELAGAFSGESRDCLN
uniref:Transthyretin-like family protein n=1 Tax=Panagrellus redivivus TaxID=6233 RepID=A0A7E4VAP1_PANRE